jgi:hypothetical protein
MSWGGGRACDSQPVTSNINLPRGRLLELGPDLHLCSARLYRIHLWDVFVLSTGNDKDSRQAERQKKE